MGDSSELVLLVGGAALINVVYAQQNKHNVAGSLVASGVTLAGLSFVGGVWRTDVAVAIAGLIFFAALVIRGLPLLSAVADLPGGSWGGGGGSF